MTNAELIARIKAEIERLKELHKTPTFKGDEYEEGGVNGYQLALDKLLSFISTLESEKPAPADLEEAADEHVNNIAYCGDDIEFEKEQSKRDFIAGADWQREQMMKGAVEGKIIFLLNGDVAINIGDIDEYKLGQKVRIIVKED